jgi:hypothetical protein
LTRGDREKYDEIASLFSKQLEEYYNEKAAENRMRD